MNEFNLIKKYLSRLSDYKKSFKLNDDVFFDKSKNLVVSVDTYVEGIHFLNFKNPNLVIKKILRSSISDLLCKGVIPKYYFISASGNDKSFTSSNLRKLSKSLKEEQSKFKILLCGGDTVFSPKLSFSITVIGFSKKIIQRNNANVNDDIYVTGNLGDSFIGLKILKKEILLKNQFKKYFIYKYFHPDLSIRLSKKLFDFATSSIDISDGLIADLEKLINKQKLSYILNLTNVPISKNLKIILKTNKIKNKLFAVSKGDDYQILFTAPPHKSEIIKKVTNSIGIKVSKIGKIVSKLEKSAIIDEYGNKISPKLKGYEHQF